MDTTAQELMRAIRGKRSQRAFAMKLGYRGNPVADWEAGRRYPTAFEMLRAAEVTGIDVRGAMWEFAPVGRAALKDCTRMEAEVIGRWLSLLKGKQSIVSIAASIDGLSRYSVGRILSGQSMPRLPAFLAVLQACTFRLGYFLDALVGIDAIASMKAEQEARRTLQELAWTVPWTEAIVRVLETPGYRKRGASCDSVTHVAQYLGIDRDTVDESLALLAEASVIVWDGKHYQLSEVHTVDTHANKETFAKLLAHWQRVVAKLSAEGCEGLTNYNVFSCSMEEYTEIQSLQRQHFEQIRAIVGQSRCSETVALVQNNLFALGADK